MISEREYPSEQSPPSPDQAIDYSLINGRHFQPPHRRYSSFGMGIIFFTEARNWARMVEIFRHYGPELRSYRLDGRRAWLHSCFILGGFPVFISHVMYRPYVLVGIPVLFRM